MCLVEAARHEERERRLLKSVDVSDVRENESWSREMMMRKQRWADGDVDWAYAMTVECFVFRARASERGSIQQRRERWMPLRSRR
jgi:hypothetical protein